MPTKNPRILLTVKPDTMEMLRRAAEPMGKPVATLVSEILDEARPVIEGMARAVEFAKGQRVEAFDHLAETLAETQVKAAQLQLAIGKSRRRAVGRKRSGRKRT